MTINATLTVTTYNQPMRLNNTGAPSVTYGHIEFAARTLSDIILLTRIPSGATVVDWQIRGTANETASVFKLGIKGGGTETTFGTMTFAGNAPVNFRNINNRPIRVSASDTDAQAGVDVYLTVSSGSWTASISFDFTFWYVRDGVVT